MAEANPIQQIVQINNFNLEPFEKAVYSRNHEVASALLLEALHQLKSGAQFVGYHSNPDMLLILYTRFCAAVIALLADPEFRLSQEGFNIFSCEHAIMDAAFRSSAFGTSDHLLAQMAVDPAEKDPAKIQFQDPVGLTKYMIVHSLRSGFRMNFEEAFTRDPQITFPLYVGMLTAMHACHPTAQERKEMLLGLYGIFEDIHLVDTLISPLSDAYMYCSYAQRKDKHVLKGLIHRLFAKMMLNGGYVPDTFPKRNLKRRPKMLVPLEWFTSLHAMYRCYAPVLRQLRTKFELVGIGRPHCIDVESIKEFDSFVHIAEEGIALSEVIDEVRKIKPDITYYPSIGMDLVWVALASVRLAPIQMITLGHPASTQSPVIDYALCEEGDVLDHSLFTEQLIKVPHGSMFRFVMRVDADLPVAEVAELVPEVVKLAIPAMLLKLNATFLDVLREIASKVTRRIEFHFWPNMVGTNLYQAAREIREFLPDAFTYERSQYNVYMRQMQGCHIQLGTFPFGGTNSNIDSMLLGMPMVCMEGDEPHETVDAIMARKIGLPEWLICRTRDEYVAAAVRLINDDPERTRLSRYLVEEADINGTFFGECPEHLRTAIVDAVWRVYENH